MDYVEGTAWRILWVYSDELEQLVMRKVEDVELPPLDKPVEDVVD